VTVKATDGSGYSGTASFTWTITNNVSVANPGNQTNVSGSAITAVDVTASDTSSTATLSYADNGTLPPGLSINASTGAITGTPTTAGTFAVTVTAHDSGGYSAHTSFSWTVSNIVSVDSPGDQSDISGSAINPVAIGASDTSSTATLTYSAGATLPGGLSIDPSTGSITGTPNIAGTYPVTVTVTDNAGFSAVTTFSWSITNTVTVTDPGDQSSPSGTAISPLAVIASDSLPSATLSFADNGTLPPGLSIDPATGVITGTPDTGGSYPVTITVTDSAAYSAQVSFTWTVTNTVTVTDPGDQTNASGTAVSPLAVAASDTSSTATLTWSATGLPAGLTIDASTGTISGTPTTAGTFPVTVTVTDSAGTIGSTAFTWTVTNTVTVTGPSNQTSGVGAAITAVHVGASDSSPVATLSFSAGGTLPTGLVINAGSGTISGTPTRSGVYAVTITATDSAGYTGTASFTWTVVGPVITAVKHTTGPGAGGTKVAIAGLHLAGATSVEFGSVPAASFTVNAKGTKLTAISPAEVAGTVDIVVTTPAGPTIPTSIDHFTFIGPSVTAVAPTVGSVAGGKKVTVSGTGLTGATSVLFGSVPGTSIVVNAKGTKLTVIAPAQAAGPVDIVVTTPGGTSPITSGDEYIYG
jgi:hypothetical protein